MQAMRAKGSAPLCPDRFRQGMRRLAGACTIITSAIPGEGREGWAGLTATAVSSVTADPARLLVCVNRSVWAHRIITQSGIVGINVLGNDCIDLAQRFAGGKCSPTEKFAAGSWNTDPFGAPLLDEAIAAFDCRVVENIEASTHDIFICEVVAVKLRDEKTDPLIYFDGAFLANHPTH